MTFQVRESKNIFFHCSSLFIDFVCVCISIRRRRAATLQHPASVGEVHHGAAGGAVLLPRLPASGPGHHHRQLVARQVRGAVQDHRRQQTLLPVPQVHSWLLSTDRPTSLQLTPSIWEQHLRSIWTKIKTQILSLKTQFSIFH